MISVIASFITEIFNNLASGRSSIRHLNANSIGISRTVSSKSLNTNTVIKESVSDNITVIIFARHNHLSFLKAFR